MAEHTETGKIGKRGVYTIPASLRRRFGLAEGALIIAEGREDGILLRPAVASAIEAYSDDRIAEFLLASAADTEDYEAARKEVRAMGLNPDKVRHRKPTA